jgi:hypothetical protein
MKILVRFKGDNDFCTVMRAFGTLLAQHESPETLIKQQVAEWFNTISGVLYQMVQARRDSTPDLIQGIPSAKYYGEYLQIEPMDVYIGDAEVEGKFQTYSSWGNGDSVLVDFNARDYEPKVTIV